MFHGSVPKYHDFPLNYDDISRIMRFTAAMIGKTIHHGTGTFKTSYGRHENGSLEDKFLVFSVFFPIGKAQDRCFCVPAIPVFPGNPFLLSEVFQVMFECPNTSKSSVYSWVIFYCVASRSTSDVFLLDPSDIPKGISYEDLQDAVAFGAQSRGKSALEGLGAGDVRRFQVQDLLL